jgi:hypothetical protein
MSDTTLSTDGEFILKPLEPRQSVELFKKDLKDILRGVVG